jgi:hypothetical protein
MPSLVATLSFTLLAGSLAFAGVPMPGSVLLQESEPEAGGARIIVLRGEAVHSRADKGRATQAVVEIRDENNVPVVGAAVTFLLPKTGASGVFANGDTMAVVVTNNAGQASASFVSNQVAGQFELQVSANVNGQALSTSLAQVNTAVGGAAASGSTESAATKAGGTGGGISGTTIGILVGVAAAAAVGVGVAVAGGGSPPGGSPAAPAPPRGGTASISIGGPPSFGPPR